MCRGRKALSGGTARLLDSGRIGKYLVNEQGPWERKGTVRSNELEECDPSSPERHSSVAMENIKHGKVRGRQDLSLWTS